MTSASPGAAARRFWSGESVRAETPEELAGATERVTGRFRVALTNWVGADAYATLLRRALGSARAAHPALATVTARAGFLEGITASAEDHGAAAVRAGVLAVVVALIELISRFVGEEMAVRFVEQSRREHESQDAETDPRGARDD